MTADKVYRSELTPVDFLRRSGCVFPAKTAVVHGNRRYTYAQFAERASRLASGLLSAGFQTGDRVAFLSPNAPALLEAHFAVPALGGVLVPINTRLQSAEIDYILSDSGARFLFVDEALYPQVAALEIAALEIVHIADTGQDDDPYEQFLAAASPDPLPRLVDDEETPISMNYTSGTTGQPKGVLCTHRGAYLNAMGQIVEIGFDRDSVFLWTLPMFHCNGWCCTWAITAVGGTHVCLRQIEPDAVWDLLTRERITHYNGAPTVQIMMVNSPKARPLSHPVTVSMGGAPPSPTLLAQMKELNFQPIHLYGLTETYGPITICTWPEEWDELPAAEQARLRARQGQGYITAEEVRVVDEQSRDVPRDGKTIGEVAMRGNTVMKGYYNQPEATKEAFRHGFFHSGDLAVWHPDGYIELRDRQKDIIISGGENISTIEVEQVVARHPAVLECAVVAMPHEKWGERPKAFVALKDGQAADEDEIIAFCREQLAHFKCPDAVAFGPLPKTSTGKVQKYVLREREWVDRERRIN
jgi:fatty-acyl-CoA synthase